ncbi:MAG: ethanolamine utilization protein EutN [Ignavibacteriae bacterium HGW-Ignavibacteriae-2]|jgi:ethanolamine utilization protein EutN|nr:EutN/CcmL family microcompartment protein [Bacteroidota bacterium]PKL86997.1 MAG: ethanolamine utilization protein EutN [Ignavibacteriae bacterium HGW-Ignavibacteriae-2]
MEIAKVIGNVVATVKMENMGNGKLLLVRAIDEHCNLIGPPQVAFDIIGAGEDEIVLLIRGSSARASLENKSTVDLNIVGIVDSVRADGKMIYNKHEPNKKEK